MPDPADSMAETTEDCSLHGHIVAIFSNLDADLRSLGPASPVVTTDPETTVISPPDSAAYLPNLAPTDEQYSPDFISTIELIDNDLAVEVPPTAGVHLPADNSNEDQYEPPPTYSFSNL